MREAIIKNGVKNLKAYGYPNITPENILTDAIYKAFFAEMLRSNIGCTNETDSVINQLLTEMGE